MIGGWNSERNKKVFDALSDREMFVIFRAPSRAISSLTHAFGLHIYNWFDTGQITGSLGYANMISHEFYIIFKKDLYLWTIYHGTIPSLLTLQGREPNDTIDSGVLSPAPSLLQVSRCVGVPIVVGSLLEAGFVNGGVTYIAEYMDAYVLIAARSDGIRLMHQTKFLHLPFDPGKSIPPPILFGSLSVHWGISQRLPSAMYSGIFSIDGGYSKNKVLKFSYKVCYARILNLDRNFLEPALCYYNISRIEKRQIGAKEIAEATLEQALAAAVMCKILAAPEELQPHQRALLTDNFKIAMIDYILWSACKHNTNTYVGTRLLVVIGGPYTSVAPLLNKMRFLLLSIDSWSWDKPCTLLLVPRNCTITELIQCQVTRHVPSVVQHQMRTRAIIFSWKKKTLLWLLALHDEHRVQHLYMDTSEICVLNVITEVFGSYFKSVPRAWYYDERFRKPIDNEGSNFSCFSLHSIENDLVLVPLELLRSYSTFAGDQTLYNVSMAGYIYITLLEI
ncbi:hypothetical protein RND71_017636 [Anisodus tanguticus]|uniref:Uncharacterized protein n=1 Tax=Anisodus tanguticus TaxID=243964 RepID=A0AAE1VJB7_9SOLA|nr:hypothetical protein RND71_017636 [Anisodus tanguticus]